MIPEDQDIKLPDLDFGETEEVSEDTPKDTATETDLNLGSDDLPDLDFGDTEEVPEEKEPTSEISEGKIQPQEAEVVAEEKSPVVEEPEEEPDPIGIDMSGFSDEEKEVFTGANNDVSEWYRNMGGMTPVKKMNEFSKQAKMLMTDYEDSVLLADSQEQLDKINEEYKQSVYGLASDLGLQVTPDGDIKPFDREMEQYADRMDFYLRTNQKEYDQANQDSYFNDWSEKMAGALNNFYANTIDLMGTISGVNYFEGYRNLSEGQRLRAEQFRAQSQRYDSTIEESVLNGDIGKAASQAFMSASESLPAMIPIFVNPTYGIYAMGANAAMEQYRHIEDEDVPKWTKVVNAISHGLVEIMAVKWVTAPLLSKSKQAIISLGKRRGTEAIKKTYETAMKNSAYKAQGYLSAAQAESLSEGATQISNNISDKVMLDADIEVTDGVFDAMTVGWLMGKVFDAPNSMLRRIQKGQQKKIAEKVAQQVPRDIPLEQYYELTEIYAQKEGLQYMEDNLAPEFKGKYQDQIIQLNDKAEAVINSYNIEQEAMRVGEMAEDKGMQSQLDYLLKKGVDIPDGTNSEQLQELYDEQVTKEQATTEQAKETAQTAAIERVKTRRKEQAQQRAQEAQARAEQEVIRAEQRKVDDAELDVVIEEKQKELGLPDTPDVKITEESESTLDKIDANEPVLNTALKDASAELKERYDELEAMKKSDTRQYSTEQIEGMQEVLGEEITKLENYATKQAEEGEFVTEIKDRQDAEKRAEQITEQLEDIDTRKAEIDKQVQEGVSPAQKEVLDREFIALNKERKNLVEEQSDVNKKLDSFPKKESTSKQNIDNLNLNVKTVRDYFNRDSIGDKSFNDLNKSERDMMESLVLGLSNNSKVLDAVISLVPVDVMNDMVGRNRSAREFFNDPAMLRDALALDSNKDVVSKFFNSIMDATSGAVVSDLDLGRIPQKILSAPIASDMNLSPHKTKIKKVDTSQTKKVEKTQKTQDRGASKKGTPTQKKITKKDKEVEDAKRTETKTEKTVPPKGTEGRKAEPSRVRDTKQDRKPKKIKEKAKNVADTVRKAKFVQTMSDLDKLSTDPTALLKVAWDGSLEVAAKTIEAGGTTAQVVADALNHLKNSEWYQNLSEAGKKKAEEIFNRDLRESIRESKKIVKKADRLAKKGKRVDKPKADKEIAKEAKELGKMPSKRGDQDVVIKGKESTLFKQQIRQSVKLMNKTRLGINKEYREFTKGLLDTLKEGQVKNFITPGQYMSIARRIGNAVTPKQRENALKYVDDVINKGKWTEQYQRATKLMENVKKRNKGDKSVFGKEGKPLVDELTQVDLKQLTESELYFLNQELSKIFAKGKVPRMEAVQATLSLVVDKPKIEKQIAALPDFKKMQEYLDKVEEKLADLSVDGSVRDYMNIKRQISTLRNKAIRMKDQGEITDAEFELLNEKLDKDSEHKDSFERQLKWFKEEYSEIVANHANIMYKNLPTDLFPPEIEKQILQILYDANAEALNQLPIADIEAMHNLITNIGLGFTLPQIAKIGRDLKTNAAIENSVLPSFGRISNSKRWKNLRDRNYRNRALRNVDYLLRKGQKLEPAQAFRFLIQALAKHRLPLTFGDYREGKSFVLDTFAAVSKTLSTEAKVLETMDKARMKMWDKFRKNYNGDPEDGKVKIGMFLKERSWQQEQNFIDEKVTDKNASINEASLTDENRAKNKAWDSYFLRDKRIWREIMKEARANNLTKKVNGVEVLDTEKYEAHLRKDKAVNELLDSYESYMEEIAPYTEWATIEDGRTFQRKEKYYPFMKMNTAREVTSDNVKESVDATNFNTKMQASATRWRTGALEWFNSDVFDVMEQHTNESLRNYHVYPTLKSSVDALRKAGKMQSAENLAKTDGKDDNDMYMVGQELANNLVDQVSAHYNSGKFANKRLEPIQKLLKSSVKGLLAKPAKTLAEYPANFLKAFLSTGQIPNRWLSKSKATRRVYNSLLDEYVSQKYFSKYSPEVGGKVFKGKKMQTLEKGAEWFIVFSDQAVGRAMFGKQFDKQFKKITGKDFDPKEYQNNTKYVIENGKAIHQAAATAVTRLEELFNAKTSMSIPQLTRFMGGTLKLEAGTLTTQTLDFVQSFARNETDQFVTAWRRLYHGDMEQKAKGVGDLMSLMISNAAYGMFRGTTSVLQAGAIASLLGVALSDWEEERKDKLTDLKQWDNLLGKSLVTLGTGGNARIFGIAGKVGGVAMEMTGLLNEKQTEAYYKAMSDLYFERRITPFGSRENLAKSMTMFPSVVVSDTIKVMALAAVLGELVRTGEISEEKMWEAINAVNIILKHVAPNPVSPTAQPLIEKQIRKQAETPDATDFGDFTESFDNIEFDEDNDVDFGDFLEK